MHAMEAGIWRRERYQEDDEKYRAVQFTIE